MLLNASLADVVYIRFWQVCDVRSCRVQSARQATACRLLPPVHWALLYTIGALFVSTFILFETGGSFSNEGRHILFTVLCGLMSFVLVVRPPFDSVIRLGAICRSHLKSAMQGVRQQLLHTPYLLMSWTFVSDDVLSKLHEQSVGL